MATLRVSPWEYSAIRKNANDMTEAEFVVWMLGKWPFLSEHRYEEIEVVVDYENGDAPSVWDTIQPSYILSIRSIK
jgi:hypothetical protein